MSEITPNDLVENITLTVDDAEVIPVPVDPTLSVQGEAADAKATGDAIAAVFTGATVNGKSFVSKAVTVYAGDILMSNETGAQTVKATIETITDKDASQIMYDTINLVSVKSAIDGIKTEIDTELSTDAIDEIFAEVFSDEESE